MVRKKMEGSEQQRRRKAREARERGHTASEEGATTGASKQRQHADSRDGHRERLEKIREGKQDVLQQNTPEPRPGYAGRDD